MRHVIIGAQTPIGSSIIRLLTSINLENIIAISPEGTLPDGVDPKKVTAFFGDVLDPYTLLEVIMEDDIVYNCQIISDETSGYDEAELYNQTGIINVLGVSSEKKVRKIVIAYPQALGYKIPENSSEEDWGEKPSPIQRSLRSGLMIIKKYWDEEPFGWDPKAIMPSETISDSDDLDSSNSTPTIISGPVQTSGPKMNTGPSISNENSEPSSGPSLGPRTGSGPSLASETGSGPSLGPKTGPSLSSSSEPTSETNQEGPKEDENFEKDENGVQSANSDDIYDEGPEEIHTEEEDLVRINYVPLVVARLPKLFGPFDENLTSHFCQAVRLQRLRLKGKIDPEISWINPIDAGRAMIVIGETELEEMSKQFHFNGFNASRRDLLSILDDINHSTLHLKVGILFPSWLKHIFTTALSKIGLRLKDHYYGHLQYSVPQTFDDTKAKNELNWDPKYDLERTAKDALNWFTSHHV